jgi:hypothetical protein
MDDCKEDAWTKFHVGGLTFKNQGDCMSFVETLGRTHPGAEQRSRSSHRPALTVMKPYQPP